MPDDLIKLHAPDLIEIKEYSYKVKVHSEDNTRLIVHFPKSASYCPDGSPFELYVERSMLLKKEEDMEQYILCED